MNHGAFLKASDALMWPEVSESLLPGAHVILIGESPWLSSVNARRAGMEVRDTIAIASPKGLSFAVLLRKPLEGTVADQLLKTGTGAINIDACRIGMASEDDYGRSAANARGTKNAHGGFEGKSFANAERAGSYAHSTGRWPSNLVFVHGEGCRQEGTKTVQGANRSSAVGRGREGTITTGVYGARQSKVATIHVGEDGTETVPNWICIPGCPVAALDRQSLGGGMHSAGGPRQDVQTTEGRKNWSFHTGARTGHRFGDAGGASRFYKQFRDDSELKDYLVTLILPENGALLESP